MTGPCFATIPWIASQGDALIDRLVAPGSFDFDPIETHDSNSYFQRHALNHLALKRPDVFARYFELALMQSPHDFCGLLLTHDWPAPMRIAAEVARAHGLPVITATHEGLFADPSLYYANRKTGAKVPVADIVFVWGNLHKQIFVARGFPAERIIVSGSAKLAACKAGKIVFDRQGIFASLGLRTDGKLVSYIAQPLDNLVDIELARERQIENIAILQDICVREGWHLAVRMPPQSAPDVISARIARRWGGDPPFSIVGDGRVSLDPLVQIAASSLIVGYCSTMLVEAALLDKPAIIFSAGMPVTMFQKHLGLPHAEDQETLRELMYAHVQGGPPLMTDEGREWMTWAFGLDKGDEREIVERIRANILERFHVPVAIAGPGKYASSSPSARVRQTFFRQELRARAAIMKATALLRQL